MKTCTKCGETKPFADFYPNVNGADGYSSWCRQCQRANVKRHAAQRRAMNPRPFSSAEKTVVSLEEFTRIKDSLSYDKAKVFLVEMPCRGGCGAVIRVGGYTVKAGHYRGLCKSCSQVCGNKRRDADPAPLNGRHCVFPGCGKPLRGSARMLCDEHFAHGDDDFGDFAGNDASSCSCGGGARV